MLKTKVVKSLLNASILAALAAPVALYAQTDKSQTSTSGQTTGATTEGASTTGQVTGTSSAAAGKLSKADQNIVMEMARANMAEIETGKLALSKTQNAEVKAFAQRMVDDHTTALNDVTALAQAKGVTLPTELDAKNKAMAARLGKMEGDAFDKAYMKQAGVDAHSKVHAKLKKDSTKAKDPEVRALASKMMPTVEQHLSSAKDMTKSGAKSDTMGTSGTRGKTGTSGTDGTSGTSGTTGSTGATTTGTNAGSGTVGQSESGRSGQSEADKRAKEGQR